MMSTPDNASSDLPGKPPVVDLATWQAARQDLLVREKAHTREGDAIAAARRRLPMVELDGTVEVVGADGSVPLVDLFPGSRRARCLSATRGMTARRPKASAGAAASRPSAARATSTDPAYAGPGPALGVGQPGEPATPREAPADGLGAQRRVAEDRQADDAVAGGGSVAEGRYRRRDPDPFHGHPRDRPAGRRAV